jgi:rhodanese-related sulfurtransferase
MTNSGAGGYAGDKSAIEAYDMLKKEMSAVLVDVRTKAEWEFVGVPDLSEIEKEPIFVEWQEYPSMRVNPNFAERLVELIGKHVGGASSPILFLCRSGARSRSAAIAMTAAGQSRCFNIAGGFEGGHDDRRRRGARNGWKASGLPWSQA